MSDRRRLRQPAAASPAPDGDHVVDDAPDIDVDDMNGDVEYLDDDEVDDDLYDDVAVVWEVEPGQRRTWSFALKQITRGGREELIAELPLDGEGAADLIGALDVAYQQMTGETLLRVEDFTAAAEPVTWQPSTWSNSPQFRTVVITAVVAIAVTLLAVNLL